MAAVRFHISAPAGTDVDELLFDVLAGVPSSWLHGAGGLTVWAAEGDAGAARAAFAAAGLTVTREETEPDRDWVAASADLRTPVAVGRYLLDPHEGARAAPAGARLRLHIPATRAFGTGSHESTRLALRLLTRAGCAGRRVLDVGCGAGTLAFVASLEEAARVFAFDLDPDAAFATAGLAAENGIERVSVFAGPLEALGNRTHIGLAVANMVQEELAPLLPGLFGLLHGGGLLVTSGQLVSREAEWLSVLRAHGFTPTRLAAENEWLATLSRA